MWCRWLFPICPKALFLLFESRNAQRLAHRVRNQRSVEWFLCDGTLFGDRILRAKYLRLVDSLKIAVERCGRDPDGIGPASGDRDHREHMREKIIVSLVAVLENESGVIIIVSALQGAGVEQLLPAVSTLVVDRANRGQSMSGDWRSA